MTQYDDWIAATPHDTDCLGSLCKSCGCCLHTPREKECLCSDGDCACYDITALSIQK